MDNKAVPEVDEESYDRVRSLFHPDALDFKQRKNSRSRELLQSLMPLKDLNDQTLYSITSTLFIPTLFII